ncbi:MAG TPA: tyrosine--tRNA ligase [Candidatus Paceibacterota bacterium]
MIKILSGKENKPQNNEELVNSLFSRSVQEVLPSKDLLSSKMAGKKLRVYAGIDPTGPTLHLGHVIVLKKLAQFQALGHETILLIGDFTAMIGDPTDKASVRKALTEAEVKKNLKLYIKQAGRFINFTGRNKAKVVYNSKWLKGMNMKNVLELTSLMTVDQMMKRDMFATRSEEGKPIYMHEFMYPLLQGYDSVALDADVEIGGNDQMFNMMVGRDFQKRLQNKEKVCITVKLLADATGKKMGKSEGNMASLLDSNFEMFGKVMSWTDGMMESGFELCTNLSSEELESVRLELKDPSVNPRDMKVRLAYEVVSMCFGEESAITAKENFIRTFSNNEVPQNIEEIGVRFETPLGLILQNQGLVASAGEFKRLVKEGAVSTMEGEKITDFNYQVTKPVVVKVGKRRFLDIKIH